MMRSILAAAFGTLTAATAATAAPVALDTLYGFGFDGVGTALVGTAGGPFSLPVNPAGTDSPDAPWTFDIAPSSAGSLIVLDLSISSDEFEIFNFGESLGVTSSATSGGTCGVNFTCAFGDPNYSRGVFALSAGSYSISGIQITGIPGAGAFIIQTAVIPVPASGLLLLGALAGGAGLAARRRKAHDAG